LATSCGGRKRERYTLQKVEQLDWKDVGKVREDEGREYELKAVG